MRLNVRFLGRLLPFCVAALFLLGDSATSRLHAQSGAEASLLATLRGLEDSLREDVGAAAQDSALRLREAFSELKALNTRLARLERDRVRPERWPVEIPWTYEYTEGHRSFIATALDDARDGDVQLRRQ